MRKEQFNLRWKKLISQFIILHIFYCRKKVHSKFITKFLWFWEILNIFFIKFSFNSIHFFYVIHQFILKSHTYRLSCLSFLLAVCKQSNWNKNAVIILSNFIHIYNIFFRKCIFLRNITYMHIYLFLLNE